MSFDVHKVRRDFPILHQLIKRKPLVYLDNAATSQKPLLVIDAIARYYETNNANVHRGVHTLSERATEQYEEVRVQCQRLIKAHQSREIIFCRGTTEAINLVAYAYGDANVNEGDEILISELEHHSNIVPWQLLAKRRGAILKVASINDKGEIEMEKFSALLSVRTKIVAVSHISNALGTINPIKEITRLAHKVGAVVLIDGAQGLAHSRVNVEDINCDFYAASSHKMYGPTGIGFLYGKAALLEAMQPFQGGGEMIRQVNFEQSVYAPIPYKFEAGTPNIGGTIGFGAAISYINELDRDAIAEYEQQLLAYATEKAMNMPGLKIIGTAKEKASILSFVLENIHPHDVGTILDHEGIAVRTGHHCAMPVMQRFKVPATVRASFAFYNTMEEVDALFAAVQKVQGMFRHE